MPAATKPLTHLKNNWKAIALALALILAAGGWYANVQIKSQADLTFVKPERTNLTKTLEVTGYVDAKEKARLRFIAGGKIIYLGAKEGDIVSRGQTIATIDRATLQKQLEQDLNIFLDQRESWENTLDDTQDRGLDDREQRQKNSQQRALNNRVLDIEMRNIAIHNTVLSAPFAGVLTVAPTAVPGVQLLATDFFEIVNPTSLVFRALVDETEIALVEIGQPATLILDAFPDEPINTTVSYIAFTSSQTTSGTAFAVEFALPPEFALHRYRLGMGGDIAIELQTVNNILTIPYIATRARGDKIYVDVRTGERSFEERQIKTGLETDDQVEVLEGLKETEEILLPSW
jgi:membrane fusion protein, macrolide-specific efflux system